MQGQCTCGEIRYRLTDRPLFTHCCHCSWCQRETGSAFALNAMIETHLIALHGTPELVHTPSNSGKGQEIARCPTCRIALYSHYAGAGRAMAFVRVGTLNTPALCPPDIHIFTTTRQPWVQLPPDIPAVPEFYDRAAHWPQWALDRHAALLARPDRG